MAELVERVAVWFCRQRGLDPSKPVWTGPIHGPRHAVPTWTRFEAEARDLIAEIREPTEAMCGNHAIDMLTIERARAIHDSSLPAAAVWRAMIDEALKQPGTTPGTCAESTPSATER